MADFVTGRRLGEEVYDIIFNARKQLLIVSPFIKLDDYFKREVFNKHKSNAELHIIIAFGKNEHNPSRSFNKSDFEYFKEFNNISIVYVPNLHAKFYANESKGIVTSINLYDYSFRNNVEFGVLSETKFLEIGGASLDTIARNESIEVLKDNYCVFVKRPKFKKKLLLGKDFVGAEVLLDLTEDLLRGRKLLKRDISEFIDEEYVDFKEQRERVSREDFEKKSSTKVYEKNVKFLSGSALARTKGKSLSDLRAVMADKGYVIENKITPSGKEVGIKLQYSESGGSWIVYPESLNKLL